jgi:hypothetical protein
MSTAAITTPSDLFVWPNLGAEEGAVTLPGGAHPKRDSLAQLWSLSFGAGARILGDTRTLAVPQPGPPEPAFDFLPTKETLVAWLADDEARQRARELGVPLHGAAPEVVARVHDKAFAVRLAEDLGVVPETLRGCVSVLEPAELEDPEHALAAIRDRLAAWPADRFDAFTLKPRFGCNARGRLGGLRSRLEPEKICGGLARLARRGGAILEPWLERSGDLSAHWWIFEDGDCRLLGTLEAITNGAGLCLGHRGQIDSRGRVASGHRVDEPLREVSAEVAQAASRAGHRGPLCIDAFCFRSPDSPSREVLRPLVEVNARFSVGWTALAWLRRLRRDDPRAAAPAPGQLRHFGFGIDSGALGWDAGNARTTEVTRIALAEGTDASAPALLFGDAPIPFEGRR